MTALTPGSSPESFVLLGEQKIGSPNPVWIIAEIGINHEGSVETCARMIEEAARSGADAVKLQTVDADESYAPGTESHTVFSKAALTREETAQMFSLARNFGVHIFTTVGDLTTLEWVELLNPVAYKISSGLLTSLPIIRKIAETAKPVLMSTGMATIEDIDAALKTARAAGAENIGLFQCTSIYPAPLSSLNLRSINWLTERYNVPTGFSDHSIGIEAASLAVAAGATMIEKHFSLDTSQPGFDHPLSLDPDDFTKMVAGIRRAEQALGVADKPLSVDEVGNATRFHRTLAARRNLIAGTIITQDDVGIMRLPPDHGGLSPSAFDDVIGRLLAIDRLRYDPIRSGDLE